MPTYRLLGGAAPELVLLYRHVRCDSIPNMIEHAHALVSEGYGVLRISPFDAFASDGVFDAELRAVLGRLPNAGSRVCWAINGPIVDRETARHVIAIHVIGAETF